MAVYSLANAAGAAFRSALNTVLGKLHRNYLGTTDPSGAGESTGGMLWIDTNLSPPVLKIRNAADSAWISIGAINTTFEPSNTSAFIRTLLDDADAAAARTTLGAQASDADLTAIAGLARARGDLIRGGASAWERVALGTAGQVLSSDGTDAVWAAPSSGQQFLSSIDFANDAVADFSLSADYDYHKLVLNNVVPATDNVNFNVRTSTDGGSTFDSGASDYNWSWIGSLSSSNAVQILNDSADSKIDLAFASGATGIGSGAGEDGLSGVIYVLGHHLAKQTRIMGKVVYTDASGVNRVMDIGGARLSAADVDAIRFFCSSGNIESGSITHFGGKNA